MKLTYPTSLVLQALSRGSHHGFDIMDVTGLPSGTVYPILRRLDREGLLESAWEKAADAQREQRPPRRYYEITPAAEALLVEAAARYRALDQAVRRVPRRLKPSRAAVSMLSRGRTGSGLGAGGSGLGARGSGLGARGSGLGARKKRHFQLEAGSRKLRATAKTRACDGRSG